MTVESMSQEESETSLKEATRRTAVPSSVVPGVCGAGLVWTSHSGGEGKSRRLAGVLCGHINP